LIKHQIKKNSYFDSVSLMILSRELKKLPGVSEALVGMGTELNLEIAHNVGLFTEELTGIGANDFFVSVQAETEAQATAAIAEAEVLLNKKNESKAALYFPPTLDKAISLDAKLNMAVISVPGAHAADLAQSCIDRNIHVMLFSDNVTVEEERTLKENAAAKGLMVMGPDCGTAIVNHVPLAFANVVRAGAIGVCAASGTGAQEVSSLIDQLGEGVSQLLGTGGRDLKKEIGGIMMKQALAAMAEDEATRVILLVSKPPAKEIAAQILAQAKDIGKPCVVCFLGGDRADAEALGLTAAISLEDAAHKAVALLCGETPADFTGFAMGEDAANALAAREAAQMAQGQRYVRGFYTGGTLCDESMKLLLPSLGHIYSNIPLQAADKLADAKGGESREHTFLDFGDDEFTVGRPHPMIDPSLRAERVRREANDPACAVLLCDCVIGYGSHPDPAADLAEAIAAAKATASAAGRHLACICAVCGTEGDPQSLTRTQKTLESAGAIVMPSNAQAARLALLITEKIG